MARYLREVIGGESREAILAFLDGRLGDPWWREPILLLAGYTAAHAARSARDFLSALARAGSQPNARFAAAELAGTAALEWRDSGETIRADCAQRLVDLLSGGNAQVQSKPDERARRGEVLAKLGDPRFDQERFYLPADETLGFVHIPADPEFRIGTRRADVNRIKKIIGAEVPQYEINDTRTSTPEFYIAWYPVTVVQFKAFVEATQFKIGDARALRDPHNRPVRWVNWHEALAYCDWLNDMVVNSPALEHIAVAHLVREGGWQVALPSELEWEKAARGRLQDAVFSWSDTPDPNRANYAESEIGDTSAVGCFPANSFGLYDMIGNVWEWTRSLWGKSFGNPEFAYPYDPNDASRENLATGGDVFRVVRGGSWNYYRDGARCAYRSMNLPGNRSFNLGFRVVLRSTPVR